MNPVILVRWYYLSWYEGWQGCENMEAANSLKEGIPNIGGLYGPDSWVDWASQ